MVLDGGGMYYTARNGFFLDSSTIIANVTHGEYFLDKTIFNYLEDFGMMGIVTPIVIREVRGVIGGKYKEKEKKLEELLNSSIIYVEDCPVSEVKSRLPAINDIYDKARKEFEEYTGRILDSRNKMKRKKQKALQKNIAYKMLKDKLVDNPAERPDRVILAQASYLKDTKYENMYLISRDTHFCPIEDSGMERFMGIISDKIFKATGVICIRAEEIAEKMYKKEYETIKTCPENL